MTGRCFFVFTFAFVVSLFFFFFYDGVDTSWLVTTRFALDGSAVWMGSGVFVE